jgi:16S rRNA (uracil1498-N3)-methyltransferase
MRKTRRFYIDEREASPGKKLLIRDPERHHILHVLRLRAGDTIELFEASGSRYSARILECLEDALSVEVIERREEPPPHVPITLLQGIPRSRTMDLIVQKCTELGVSEIVPILCERSGYEPTGSRLERWRKIAREACKQCGRSRVPEIGPPRRFADFIPTVSGGRRLLLDPAETGRTFRDAVRETSGRTLFLLVGPEGGLTLEEVGLAVQSGFTAASLGETILRAETAAIVAVGILRYELGD